jgi:hypothetical protein
VGAVVVRVEDHVRATKSVRIVGQIRHQRNHNQMVDFGKYFEWRSVLG